MGSQVASGYAEQACSSTTTWNTDTRQCDANQLPNVDIKFCPTFSAGNNVTTMNLPDRAVSIRCEDPCATCAKCPSQCAENPMPIAHCEGNQCTAGKNSFVKQDSAYKSANKSTDLSLAWDLTVNTGGVACGFMPANGKCDGITFDTAVTLTHGSGESALWGSGGNDMTQLGGSEFQLCCYPEGK